MMKRTFALLAVLCAATVVLSVAAETYALRIAAAVALLTAGILAGLVAGIETTQQLDASEIAQRVSSVVTELLAVQRDGPIPYDQQLHDVLQSIQTKVAELQRQVSLVLERVTR